MLPTALGKKRYTAEQMARILRDADAWIAGGAVTRKRVRCLWRQEGLRVPQKQRKRRLLRCPEGSGTRRCGEHINEQAEALTVAPSSP